MSVLTMNVSNRTDVRRKKEICGKREDSLVSKVTCLRRSIVLTEVNIYYLNMFNVCIHAHVPD